MHIKEKRGRWSAPAAALLAAALLGGAVLPASAAMSGTRTAFHHHFYRGVPGQSLHRGTAGSSDMMALAAESGVDDEAAVAYCADRFRSYDPASGTYLGYDGNEHACP